MDNFPILYLLTVPWHIRLSSFQILVTLAHGINKSWLAEKLPELTKISSGSLTANQKAGIRWARVTNSRVGLATSYTFGDGNYNFTFSFSFNSVCFFGSTFRSHLFPYVLSETYISYIYFSSLVDDIFFIYNTFWNQIYFFRCQ